MSRLQDYDTTHAYDAIVKENSRITPADAKEEIRHLVLEIEGSGFNFVEGQSIGIAVPGSGEFGSGKHFRLYSIASTRESGGTTAIELAVKRCFYIDEFSGEEVAGVASNYLCDLKVGDKVTFTGPYGREFVVPADETCNLLMIGMGTGIATFRAFVKHIYGTKGGWKGQVRLFFGARSGLELIYMNDEKNDFAQYYDEGTFKAFQALSPRPHMNDEVALDKTIEENAEEVWGLLKDPKTYVFMAGIEKVTAALDKAMATVAGSELQWQQKKAEIVGAKRWFELIY